MASRSSAANEHHRMAFRLAVAAEVRALMGRHRVSQTRLAQEMGVSQATLSRRLVGEVAFDLDELLFLAERFDVSLGDLLAHGSRCIPARLDEYLQLALAV